MTLAATVLGWFAVHLLIYLAPILAGVMVAQRRGVRGTPLLLSCGLLASGVGAFLDFWAYLIAPGFGRSVGIAVVVVSIAALALGARSATTRAELRTHLAWPVAYFSAVSLSMLSLGYLWGGVALGQQSSAGRFVGPLPVDNEMPLLFARQLISTTRPLPHFLIGDWQPSDRPPLLTGIYLVDHSVVPGDAYLHYQIAGVLAQSTWVFGLIALAQALRLPARLTALALLLVSCSGLTILNTVFTWPKLLPAAYLLLVVAIALTTELGRVGRRAMSGLIAGGCLGCAMLGHPGSLFFLPAIAVVVVIWRQRIALRFVGTFILAMAALYLPWIAFQRWYLPPGDKLDLEQLTNVAYPDTRKGEISSVIKAYQNAGLSRVLSNKWSNLSYPFRDELRAIRDGGHLLLWGHGGRLTVSRDLLAVLFYRLGPIVGVMQLGPIVLAALYWTRRRRFTVNDRGLISFCARALVCCSIYYAVWALVLFGPASTVLHQGSYLMPVLALFIGALCWWVVSPRLATILIIAQAAFGLAIYSFAHPAQSSPEVFLARPSHSFVVLYLAALVGAMALLIGFARCGQASTGAAPGGLFQQVFGAACMDECVEGAVAGSRAAGRGAVKGRASETHRASG